MNTKFLTLGKSDLLKSLIMLVLAAIVSLVGDAVLQAINNGDYSLASIHWREIGGAIAVTVITYLKKNLFTNSDGKILEREDDMKIQR